MKHAALLLTMSSMLISFVHGELPANCEIATNAVQQASAIRGLSVRSKVPCEVHGKELVEKFLRSTIETKLPENKLKFEEIVYHALGVVPDTFDYREGIITLYLSQLGGYYDPEKKHFIMANWMPDNMQTVVAIHELTHALQDQHYNLSKIIDPKLDSGDMGLARSALVEGDATAVMIDYTRGLMHLPPLAQEQNIDALLIQQVMSGGLMNGLEGFPEPLKNLLLFPYTSGLRFVHTLLNSGGYAAVDKAFKRLPESSEEVLHPEKYLHNRKDFTEISDSEIASHPLLSQEKLTDTKPLYTDTLGEFLITAIVGNSLNNRFRAAQSGKGWGGDKVAIFKTDEGNLIAWITKWDSDADADEFYDSYREGLAKVYKVSGMSSTPDWLKLGNAKSFKAQKNGREVALAFKN